MKLQNFIAIPTPEEYNVFKGITDKYNNCPICDSKFEYESNSYSYKMRCSNEKKHSFQCTLKSNKRMHNEIVYKKHIATFFIHINNWSIYYSSNWPSVVHLETYKQEAPKSLSGLFNSIFLSLEQKDKIKFQRSFESIDKWFDKEKLLSTIDKYAILL